MIKKAVKNFTNYTTKTKADFQHIETRFMSYLLINKLSKRIGEKILFTDIDFNIEKGDKIALVAGNGTGKSTLFKVIMGYETADAGKITISKDIRIGYLEQDPDFYEPISIHQLLFKRKSAILDAINEYESALEANSKLFSKASQELLDNATAMMDKLDAWQYEQKAIELLSRFNINDTSQLITTLSGGQKKRLALALCLIDKPDLLLLDEPTNHLDTDMIEWLENYLSLSATTLLLITHDRYFIDNVCNNIVELTNGILVNYECNYDTYLEKKAQREEAILANIEKAKNLYRKELEWMIRMPKARTHKSKARIDAFYKTKEIAFSQTKKQQLQLNVNMSRIGGKIMELQNISKSFDTIKILENFNYVFKKGERIGILGKNGVGKTSFLDILTNKLQADSGIIERGETIKLGYYTQNNTYLKNDYRVIELVKEIAEYIEMADGTKISASQLLQQFNFSPDMQYNPIAKLSGGEKRKLMLLMVLINNPNFLILDEPTNDLDLVTIAKLEEFLSQYKGCLIVVSHDRFFLDKLVDHLFIFEGDAKIRDFYGNYSDYFLKNRQEQELAAAAKPNKTLIIQATQDVVLQTKKKLTYKEQKELENLEIEIKQLEQERIQLETELQNPNLDYTKINSISLRIGEIMEFIDEKFLRLLELEEIKNA